MYSGAVRAGKTYALCLAVAMRAAVPRSREILCRKTLSALKGTTLKTLLQGDGDNPPVLPPGTYTHNKADKEIHIHGGGEIVYFALVNDGESGTQQRAGSYSGTGVNIDEATELDEADYKMLLSRASITIAGVTQQVRVVCNPSVPDHFLAKRFAPPGSGHSKPLTGCRCIATKTTDNTFLSADFIESLERERGSLWYRRFVEGLWCGSDGLVYDNWDRNIHVLERPVSDFRRFVVGVDDGFTNPFVALLIGEDGDGRLHVLREHYEPGLQVPRRVEAVRRVAGLAQLDAVLIDPSAPDVIAACAEAHIPAVAAVNDVIPGINAVSSRLLVAGDREPRLTVDPSCLNTIREMESYQWKKDRPDDQVVKKADHTCDALRYAVMYIDGGPKLIATWVGGQSKDPELVEANKRAMMIADDDMWEVV